MTNQRAEFLESVCRLFIAELVRAEKKHPVWPTDIVHQAAIVAEEAGELLQAANNMLESGDEYGFDLSHIRTEAIQTGAVALRLLINLEEK